MELKNKYIELASPKGNHGNCKRKAKLPCVGVGKGILWHENNSNKDSVEFTKRGDIENVPKRRNGYSHA